MDRKHDRMKRPDRARRASPPPSGPVEQAARSSRVARVVAMARKMGLAPSGDVARSARTGRVASVVAMARRLGLARE